MASAEQTINRNRRVFKYFEENSLEVRRIRLALISFLATLATASVLVFLGHRSQEKDYANEMRGIRLQIKDFRDLKLAPETFNEAVRDKAMAMLGTFNDDPKFLSTVEDKFLKPIILTPSNQDKNQKVEDFINYADSVIVKRHPIVLYWNFLLAWIVIGMIYLAVIFTLYYLGFDPAVGEPTFNIIDVGFIAVLVQYTGGLLNLFLGFYVFSLVLASYDFVCRKDQAPFANRRRATKVFLILGPYLFALFLSIFWATCSSWLTGDVPLQQYLSLWAVISFVAIIGMTVLCGMISYFLEREKALARPATKP
jgi:hypothetical protein